MAARVYPADVLGAGPAAPVDDGWPYGDNVNSAMLED